MTQLLPPKKEVALALLERSNVDVYLDPRAKGVVVPPQFRKEPRLILKIGLNMPVPIPDLRLDEESMSCTLSFNRSPFYCVVPWSSVFAMVGEDGRGMVWPDDVPQELAVKVVEPGEQDPRARAGAAEREAARTDREIGSTASRRNGRATKLVEDAPAAERSSSRGGTAAGGKRGKKKKEEGQRPVLVSVPQPSSSDMGRDAARSEARSEARDSAEGAAPREIREARDEAARRPHAHQPPRDGVSAIPSSRPRAPAPPSQRRPPTDGQARPKRELPPYLRVVK
jgi:stringent starvation protein B